MCPKRVKTRKALRSQKNVDTKAPALSDDRLQQVSGRQPYLVVRGNSTWNSSNTRRMRGDLVARCFPEPLHPGLSPSGGAQQFRALRDLSMQGFQDTQTEFPVRLDGDAPLRGVAAPRRTP